MHMENQYAFIASGDIFKLKNTEIFDGLAAPKIYEQDQVIYQQGDESNYLYYLKNGRIQIFLNSAGGSEKILAVCSKGSFFGKSAFFCKMPHSSCAKALTKSEIIIVDKAIMTDIIRKYPPFAFDMLEYLSKTIRMFSNQIESMTFLQTDKRIARYIVDNISDLRNPIVTCTHEEISSTVGASRVTVSKILSKFVQSGWIDTMYRAIQVIDVKAITDFALDE